VFPQHPRRSVHKLLDEQWGRSLERLHGHANCKVGGFLGRLSGVDEALRPVRDGFVDRLVDRRPAAS
jgi:hypothetical protein